MDNLLGQNNILLDDNYDWSRAEYLLADAYDNRPKMKSPLDRPRPKRSIKFDFWVRSDRAFNQFCKEWKNA